MPFPGSRWLAVSFACLRLAAAESPADQELNAYFADQVARIEGRCLADVRTRADWEARREEYRRELFDMLGLWPQPERTPLNPVVTGTVEQSDFVVENLHFESLPGLHVTANLYRPKRVEAPVPAILYVSGHANVRTNGISLGNKTGYQHHGEWFARHGYVCLTLDTLQLGEITGDHHGTYRLGQWWWNTRGYTPAGVEAWNSIRALDYLETRPEVDRNRLGMTGRSGGGSYTWTTAALDERIRAAAPVAGITDLRNQVIDGCVEGHCDCMFFVNTHRWDFALNAALVAPRPLLIVNTDRDSIFPLDGVQRLHRQVSRLYDLLGASTNLGLVIGPGGHVDTQDLQVPVFRWFNQHLRGTNPPIQVAAERLLDPGQLQVFREGPPAAQKNTTAQEWFGAPRLPEAGGSPAELARRLRQHVFHGWPEETEPPALRLRGEARRDGRIWRSYDLRPQPHVTLVLLVTHPESPAASLPARLEVPHAAGWTALMKALGPELTQPLQLGPDLPATDNPAHPLPADLGVQAWLAVRGVGPGAWDGDERRQTMIRRRFMLLGQTLDGMRVWDVVQAVSTLSGLDALRGRPLTLAAAGPTSTTVLLASLFTPALARIELQGLPERFRDSPADYLNLLRVADLPEVLQAARHRTPVQVAP